VNAHKSSIKKNSRTLPAEHQQEYKSAFKLIPGQCLQNTNRNTNLVLKKLQDIACRTPTTAIQIQYTSHSRRMAAEHQKQYKSAFNSNFQDTACRTPTEIQLQNTKRNTNLAN